MRRRQLGGSGPEVPVLGLGGNVFGHFTDASETRRIMDVAFDAGMPYVDTADVYSDGLSEELIGQAVANHRDQWFIATKAGVVTDGSRRGLGNSEVVASRMDASLRRLGTDYVDLFQMHHWDPATPVEETLTALDGLVRSGKARFVGVSNYSGAELRSATIAATERNLTRLVSVQTIYHLLKPRAEDDIFPACRSANLGVVVYGALARGILAGRYNSGRTPPVDSRAESSIRVRADLEPAVLDIVERLTKFAISRRATVGQLAIAWILRRPEVSTVLIGVRGEEQLKGNLPAAEWDLTDEEIAEIENIVEDPGRFYHLALGSVSPSD